MRTYLMAVVLGTLASVAAAPVFADSKKEESKGKPAVVVTIPSKSNADDRKLDLDKKDTKEYLRELAKREKEHGHEHDHEGHPGNPSPHCPT